MSLRNSIGATALAIALLAPLGARAFDDSKYPDMKGQWRSVAVPTGLASSSLQYDPHRPTGRAQQAPLTPVYQAIFEANMAEQALGGQAGDPTYRCLPPGMPRVMGADLEVVVLPETTYINALTGAGGFHRTIVRERIYLDKADPNLLHDEIITIDHALTHPWTIIKDYRRAPNNGPIWSPCVPKTMSMSPSAMKSIS